LKSKLKKTKTIIPNEIDSNSAQNYTKRKKRRIWIEKDMKRAVRMVERCGISGHRAAKECDVPVSSLWVRLKERQMDREDDLVNEGSDVE
jgi:hypothetical protein